MQRTQKKEPLFSLVIRDKQSHIAVYKEICKSFDPKIINLSILNSNDLADKGMIEILIKKGIPNAEALPAIRYNNKAYFGKDMYKLLDFLKSGRQQPQQSINLYQMDEYIESQLVQKDSLEDDHVDIGKLIEKKGERENPFKKAEELFANKKGVDITNMDVSGLEPYEYNINDLGKASRYTQLDSMMTTDIENALIN